MKIIHYIDNDNVNSQWDLICSFFIRSINVLFYKNPNLHLPNTIYTEWIRQSLLSTIIRITKPDITTSSPFWNPIYLILSVLILVFIIILVKK
jgi:hypothetical protein